MPYPSPSPSSKRALSGSGFENAGGDQRPRLRSPASVPGARVRGSCAFSRSVRDFKVSPGGHYDPPRLEAPGVDEDRPARSSPDKSETSVDPIKSPTRGRREAGVEKIRNGDPASRASWFPLRA